MSDSSPFAASQTPPDWVRWLMVLPAALLAGWLGRSLGGMFLFLRSDAYPESLFPLVMLLPSGLAFTVAGAFAAPRYRVPVAIGLAAMCTLLSLVIHILMQQKPGLTNYLHFAGESLGAVLGVVWAAYSVWKSTRSCTVLRA